MPRQHSRRRRRGLGGPLYSLITTVVLVVCVSVALTMFFRVRTLRVTGLHRYTEEQVRQAAGVEYGDNLFFLDKYAMKDDILRQLPYIESLHISRGYPDTLRIAVTECVHPMALYQDGTTWFISATGKIVDSAEGDVTAEGAARYPESTASGGAAEAAAQTVPADGAAQNVDFPAETAAQNIDFPADGTAQTVPADGAAQNVDFPAGDAEGTGTTGGGTASEDTGGAETDTEDTEVFGWGVITGCRLLAPAVGERIALATEDVSRQDSLLDLLAALDSAGMLSQADAIRMENPDFLYLDYAGRFTVKLRSGANFPWKLKTLAAYLASGRIQDNMSGTFDMSEDDKNYFQQDVREGRSG